MKSPEIIESIMSVVNMFFSVSVFGVINFSFCVGKLVTIFRLASCSDNAESVSGSTKSEALAISLESRETPFREWL
jgi:hypothetical protein